MKKFKFSLIITSVVLIIVFTTLFFMGNFKLKESGILINTSPAAAVYIDGVQVGRSPYKAKLPPKEVVLRLIPESDNVPLAVYETKLNLYSGTEALVNREFGETEETSSGEVVYFEKIGKKEVGLSIISIPDAAQITVDGQIRGFAPYNPPSILSGEHQIIISAPGYKQRALQVKTQEGYKLIIIAKLSVDLDEVKQKEEESKKELQKVYIEILTTPTGFLRVRQEASVGSAEIGQVKPGEKYEFVEEVESWYKIQFDTAKQGWISSQYAKKLEEASPSATPRATPL